MVDASDIITQLPPNLFLGFIALSLVIAVYSTYVHVKLHVRVKAIDGDEYHVAWWIAFFLLVVFAVIGDFFVPSLLADKYKAIYKYAVSYPLLIALVVVRIIDYRYQRRWKEYKKSQKK